MHFEILIEDQSGKKALEILVPKIVGDTHTVKVITYKGIGKIPPGCSSGADARKRLLLDNLPRLLRGYGKKWSDYPFALFIICDLDNKCKKNFRQELLSILYSCRPKPETRYCIAIEEGEAWLLGDISAIRKAYPRRKEIILSKYVNDSICGTWELLADAIYYGGAAALREKGYQAIGTEKYKWAENICPHMDTKENKSQSFCYFRNKLLDFCT